MRSGALELRDYRGDVILIDCPKCGQSWSIPKAELIALYGAEAMLPELKDIVTGCPKAGDARNYYDRCGSIYSTLGKLESITD